MNNKHSKELCHSQFQGDELYHHGILGMRWGIRRYQPYPKGHEGDGKYTGKDTQKKDMSKKKMNMEGFEKDSYGMKKTVKTKSGKPVKLRIPDGIDPKSVERNAEYVERNLDKIVKDAVDFYAKRDGVFIMKNSAQNDLSSMSAKDIAKILEVSSINVSNGLVSLEPKKDSPLSWAFPWVELDLGTGKPIRTGTDS